MSAQGEHFHDPGEVEWKGHKIRLAPGWSAFLHPDGEVESVTGPRCVARDVDPGSRTTWEGYTTGLTSGQRPTARRVAQSLATAILASQFHEAIEWVTADGTRLGDPHPRSEENWEWVEQRLLRLVQEYGRRFEVKP